MSKEPTPVGSIARNVLVALTLVALALFLWAARDVLFVLFLGLLFGVMTSAATEQVQRLGVKRGIALALVLLLGLALVGAGGWLLWSATREQLAVVVRDAPRTAERAIEWVETQLRSIGVGEGMDGGLRERVASALSDPSPRIAGGVLPLFGTAFGAIGGALIAFAVGVYTAARPDTYREGFLRLIPPVHRMRVRTTLASADAALRSWLLGSLVNMLAVGLLTFAGLLVLDVPAPAALAAIAGLLEFIPFLGPILSAVPAVALALGRSPETALGVAILFLLVQQVENHVLVPVVMQKAADLPPALTIVVQGLMTSVFGLLGLLLAVPLLAVTLVAVRELYVEPLEGA